MTKVLLSLFVCAEGVFAVDSRFVSVSNRGPGTLFFDVDVQQREKNVSASSVTATPLFGTLEANETVEVEVFFDARNLPQGVYEAAVTISTNDVEHLTTHIPLELYVFCGRFASNQSLSDRPMLTQLEVSHEEGLYKKIYTLSGVLWFTSPVLCLKAAKSDALTQALRIGGDGELEQFQDFTDSGDQCGAFSVRASVSYDIHPSDAPSEKEEICLDVSGNQIQDVYGAHVSETRICVPVHPESRSVELYGVNFIYSSDEGAVTNDTIAKLVAMFSDVVMPPDASVFDVQPYGRASVASVKPWIPEQRVFEVQIEVEEGYYGPLNVTVLDNLYSPARQRVDLDEEKTIRLKRSSTVIARQQGYILKEGVRDLSHGLTGF